MKGIGLRELFMSLQHVLKNVLCSQVHVDEIGARLWL